MCHQDHARACKAGDDTAPSSTSSLRDLLTLMDLNRLLPSLRLQFSWCALLAAFALSQPMASVCQAAGSVIPWGNNGVLQCQVPPGLANVIAVAAGDAHSVALVNDGTVAAWG